MLTLISRRSGRLKFSITEPQNAVKIMILLHQTKDSKATASIVAYQHTEVVLAFGFMELSSLAKDHLISISPK
jgi:uncharacterized protein YdeI (YjbR/CyaY-like superfamily)